MIPIAADIVEAIIIIGASLGGGTVIGIAFREWKSRNQNQRSKG